MILWLPLRFSARCLSCKPRQTTPQSWLELIKPKMDMACISHNGCWVRTDLTARIDQVKCLIVHRAALVTLITPRVIIATSWTGSFDETVRQKRWVVLAVRLARFTRDKIVILEERSEDVLGYPRLLQRASPLKYVKIYLEPFVNFGREIMILVTKFFRCGPNLSGSRFRSCTVFVCNADVKSIMASSFVVSVVWISAHMVGRAIKDLENTSALSTEPTMLPKKHLVLHKIYGLQIGTYLDAEDCSHRVMQKWLRYSFSQGRAKSSFCSPR